MKIKAIYWLVAKWDIEKRIKEGCQHWGSEIVDWKSWWTCLNRKTILVNQQCASNAAVVSEKPRLSELTRVTRYYIYIYTCIHRVGGMLLIGYMRTISSQPVIQNRTHMLNRICFVSSMISCHVNNKIINAMSTSVWK